MPESVCAIMATLSTFTLAQVRELPATLKIPAASDVLRNMPSAAFSPLGSPAEGLITLAAPGFRRYSSSTSGRMPIVEV